MTQYFDTKTENNALIELIHEVPYLILDFDKKICELEAELHSYQEKLIYKDKEIDRITKKNLECNLSLALLKTDLENERSLNLILIKDIEAIKARQIQLESKDVSRQNFKTLFFYLNLKIKKRLTKLLNFN